MMQKPFLSSDERQKRVSFSRTLSRIGGFHSGKG
jgi:hypothetical protein